MRFSVHAVLTSSVGNSVRFFEQMSQIAAIAQSPCDNEKVLERVWKYPADLGLAQLPGRASAFSTRIQALLVDSGPE